MSYLHHLFSSNSAKTLLGLIAALCLALTSFSIPAQEETSEAEEDNEQSQSTATVTTAPEVVVSASRISIPTKQIGSSVTVFNEEEIEQRQPEFLHEILREVPSVAVSQTGSGGGNASIRIRGAEANHTLVLIDGLDMGNPFSGDEFQLQHMPVSSLQSIEVLRGPQSSIHGSETIGGVISITTPIPEEGVEASVSAELGTLSTKKARSYVGFANDDFYAAITASHSESEGATSRTHNSERDGYKNQYMHLKSGFKVAENLNLSSVFIGISSEGEYDDYSGEASPFFSGTNNYLGKDKKRVLGTTLKYNEDDDPITHKISMSASNHERRDFQDGSQTTLSRGKSSKFSYQGTLNYQAFNLENSTTFAAERKVSEVSSGALSHPVGGKLKLRSAVLEHRLNIHDTGFFSISGRIDDSEDDVFDSRDTYRVTGAWILNEQTRFHGSFGTGTKNPTIQDIYGWTTEWQPNPDIKPETSKGFDFGIESRIGDGRFTLDATYFYNKITNLITIFNCVSGCQFGDPDPDGPSVYQARNSTGVSHIKGLELSARGELGDGYEIAFQLTHSDSVDANKNRLVRRPTRTASLNINKNVQILGYQSNLNFNVQHTGSQFDTGAVKLDGYTLAHLSAKLQISPNSHLTARIDNLFNKTDYEEVRGYGVAERSFHMGIKYDF